MSPAGAWAAGWTPCSRSLRRSRPRPRRPGCQTAKRLRAEPHPPRAARTPASSLADSPPPGGDSALRHGLHATRQCGQLQGSLRHQGGLRPRPAARGSLRSPCSPANTRITAPGARPRAARRPGRFRLTPPSAGVKRTASQLTDARPYRAPLGRQPPPLMCGSRWLRQECGPKPPRDTTLAEGAGTTSSLSPFRDRCLPLPRGRPARCWERRRRPDARRQHPQPAEVCTGARALLGGKPGERATRQTPIRPTLPDPAPRERLQNDESRNPAALAELRLEAEGEGFEPSEQGLPAQRFSRPPDSTTLAPLRVCGV